MFGVLPEGADVFVIRSVVPAGEAPIDNYSLGRKSLDGSLEIESKWAVPIIETNQKSAEYWAR